MRASEFYENNKRFSHYTVHSKGQIIDTFESYEQAFRFVVAANDSSLAIRHPTEKHPNVKPMFPIPDEKKG